MLRFSTIHLLAVRYEIQQGKLETLSPEEFGVLGVYEKKLCFNIDLSKARFPNLLFTTFTFSGF
jgi:hypothetical protein